MTDTPPQPGYWRASDGNWYPPESHPDRKPILIVTSHDSGRNAKVSLYKDRIERVKEKKFGSISRAAQDSEVTPIKSVSSVQAKKDGLRFTKVTVYASANNIDFKLDHSEAGRFKDGIMKLILAGSAASAATSPTPTDPLDRLKKLAELRDAGVLSDAEFEEQKTKILAS